jgi:DNA modification methylase
MMNWPSDFVNQVVCCDALDILQKMPDEVVQTCITSPPYWGLRDYGTGTWIGGDQDCSHKNYKSVQRGTSHGHTHTQPARLKMLKPYGQKCRDCGAIREDQQIGLERDPSEYVDRLVKVFADIRRVLKDDGTLWLNMGDSYSGSWGDSGNRPERSGESRGQRTRHSEYRERKGHPQADNPVTATVPGIPRKNLMMMPARLALALQADGWIVRSEIIWHKLNAMPESVQDRPSTVHEKIFLMAKSPDYYYDGDAIRQPYKESGLERKQRPNTDTGARLQNNQPGKPDREEKIQIQPVNPLGKSAQTVWQISTRKTGINHVAIFPEKLIEPCILAGSRSGDIVLDPFFGSGTTGKRAKELERKYIGIDLNPDYCAIAEERLSQEELF